jgi:predicted TPR repeat methyltransferase
MIANEEDLENRRLFVPGWLDARDPEAALREIAPVLERFPSHAGALEISGNCWSRLRNHGAAIDAFARLTALQPDHLPGWLGLAAARIENGEVVEPAVYHAIKRLTLSRPLLPDELSTLALLEIQAGQYEAGLALIGDIESEAGATGALIRLKASVVSALGDRDMAIGILRRWCRAEPTDAETWSQLAAFLREAGRHADAVEAAGEAVLLAPENAAIAYRLGLCRLDAGDRAGASDAFRRVLDLDPSDPFGAAHHIAVAQGAVSAGLAIDTMRAGFDEFAGYYDAKMVDRLGYRGPEEIRDCVDADVAPDLPAPWDILDLGCGTGLVGVALSGRKRRLVGVDLSARMLEQARRRNLYDALHQGELVEFLTMLCDEQYDVVTAGELFIYFGDLAPALAAIRSVLTPGGYLVFNTERVADDIGEIVSCHSMTFAHSQSYLRRAAAESGFAVRRCAPCFVRMEGSGPVESLITVLRAS